MGKRGAQPWEPPSIKSKDGKEFGGWVRFDELLASQATERELADYYGVSVATIERTVKRVKGMKFADYFKQKRTVGFTSLRWRTYQLAMNGDKTALVILWKKWLGLVDKVVTKDMTPKTNDTNDNKEVLAKLESLLSEMKKPEVDNKEKVMGLLAAKLGIEK